MKTKLTHFNKVTLVFLTALMFALVTPAGVNGATYYAIASGDWNVNTTWSLTSGGGAVGVGVWPLASDNVYISEGATAYVVTIPAAYTANCANLNMGAASNKAATLTFAASSSGLNVSGTVTIYGPSAGATRTINVNAGSMTIGGNLALGTNQAGNQANRVCKVVITTGTVTVGGNLVFNNIAGSSPLQTQIVMSGGAGNFNLAGAFTISNSLGTLTPGTTSTFNFNGSAAGQTIPVGVSSVVYNDLHINNIYAGGAILSAAITATNVTGNLRVQSGTFDNGGFAIAGNAAKTFSVDNGATFLVSGTTSSFPSGFGTNTIGATSTVKYSGSGNQTIFDVASPGYGHLIVAGGGTKTAAAGLDIQGNMTISAGTFAASTFTHNVAGNWTNNGTFTSGTGSVVFNGGSSQTISGSSATAFNNLTVNNANGITASIDFTVNGVLNLQSANPSSIKGSLDMWDGSVMKTLTMGASATTTGAGDVTGIVRRTSFVANTQYSFGNQFTNMTFSAGGTMPGEIIFQIRIGAAPSWKTTAVQRYYVIFRTGGSNMAVTLSLHYLDSELQLNPESNLVTWDYHSTSALPPEEHGKANQNTTENWVSISNRDISYFNGQSWGLANKESVGFVWNGSASTNWNDVDNWNENVLPGQNDDVQIPDAAFTLNDPVFPVSPAAFVKTIAIQTGGILNGGTATTFTITGGGGAWTNKGTFNCSTSKVIFTNANATIADPANFYDLNITNGAALTLEENEYMGIAGALILQGTGILRAADFPNTVEFNGTNQTIIGPNGLTLGFYNLILSGSGTKTFPIAALSIDGDFTMSGTATATGDAAMTFNGNFTLGPGTTFITGSLSHSIGGNFSNNGGIFTATGSAITLNGNSLQTIGGTTSSTFNNLILNNAAGAFLGNNETVSGSFTLTNGKITTETNTLIISNPSTGAISGGSSANYINGNLRRGIAAGANTYAFPIGTASAYAPVSMAFTAGTVAGTLLGYTTDGDHVNIGTSFILASSSVNRTWTFSIFSGLSTANYDATFNWVSGDEDISFNYNYAVAGKYTGGTWTYPTMGNLSPTSAQVTGESGFSDFQIGNGCLTPPTATISGDTNICSSGTATLKVVLTGVPNWSYTWSDGTSTGTVTDVTSSPSYFNVSPTSNKTYTIVSVTDGNGCVGTGYGSADVFTGPSAILPETLGCAGNIIEIPVTVTSFTDVGAISLTLNYNRDVMTFNSFINNSGMIDEIFTDETGPIGIVRFSGITLASFHLDDGDVLLTLKFNYFGGNTLLHWNDNGDYPGDDSWCEFATGAPDFIPYCDDPPETYYIDGTLADSVIVADFEADNLFPAVNAMTQFTDLSTGCATNWEWSFDRPTVDFVTPTDMYSQNPQVQFTDGGLYTVTLKAYNAFTNDTEVKIGYIHVGTPGIWTGDTSTDWYTATNWNDHVVPTATTDVLIPTVDIITNYYPHVLGDLTIGTHCNSITLTGTAILTVDGLFTVNPGTTLDIKDDATVFANGH